jgi:hypothetical protein
MRGGGRTHEASVEGAHGKREGANNARHQISDHIPSPPIQHTTIK